MMPLNFRYCPFCGGNIPSNTMIKFCPFCGEKFQLNENVHQNSQDDEVMTVDSQELQQLAEININEEQQKKIRAFNKSEYYSIILKNAPNKQTLVQKLEKILLRGSFAVRLAVDMVPSIIVYKAKGEDIMHLDEVFMTEEASTSIIAGDFNNKPMIQDVFTMFDTLEREVRKVIRPLPINLWIGDDIKGCFPNTYREKHEGITIITDKNIYFVANEIGILRYQWFVRSYHLLSKILMEDDCLRLIYKDNIVTSISFNDKEKLAEAYQCIYRVMKI